MPARKDPELAAQIVDALRSWAVGAGKKSDREIADYLDVSVRTFEQWARGRVPRVETRYKIAEKTGIPYEELGIPAGDAADLRRRIKRLRAEIERATALLPLAEQAERERRARKP